MKTNFSGYYSYSKSELRDILSNSLLTLDYSFLLDINKLSHGRLILETLSNFKERLWLPYDTAWLYHQKIQHSIEEQICRVDTAKKYLTSFKNAADDPMNHPYIGDELANKYDYLMKIAIESLEKESKYLSNSLFSSDIKKKILALFEGKIGTEYNSSELDIVIEEGKARNDSQLPPCSSLINSKNIREEYHYYIVWKQLQKKAQEDSKSIVFIRNKLSSNWFVSYRDTICFTTPLLRAEFENVTKKSFFCMPAYLFIKKFKPQGGNSQEYDKLLLQLHRNPQIPHGGSTDISGNQL